MTFTVRKHTKQSAFTFIDDYPYFTLASDSTLNDCYPHSDDANKT